MLIIATTFVKLFKLFSPKAWCAWANVFTAFAATFLLLLPQNCSFFNLNDCQKFSQLTDWLIGASLSSNHEKATVRYALDESAPA